MILHTVRMSRICLHCESVYALADVEKLKKICHKLSIYKFGHRCGFSGGSFSDQLYKTTMNNIHMDSSFFQCELSYGIVNYQEKYMIYHTGCKKKASHYNVSLDASSSFLNG